MPYFFVSYMHEDRDFVKTLDDRLADKNISIWTDAYLKSGDEWKKQIDLHIDDAAGVIVVITPASLVSPYVTYEWAYAKGKGKVVIPVLLKNVANETLRVFKADSDESIHSRNLEIHPRLTDLQYIDFLSPSETTWEKLISDLKIIMQGNIPSELQSYWDELSASDVSRRKNAIHTLEHYQDDAVNDVLARAITEKKLPDVIFGCALALARRTNGADPRVVIGFKDKHKLSRHDPEARYVFEVIGRIPTSDAANFLLLALTENEDQEMRALAARGLGQIKAVISADALLDCVANDKSIVVKVAAANSLADIGDHRVIEQIKQIVSTWSAYVVNDNTNHFRSFVQILIRFGESGILTVLELIRPDAPGVWNNVLIQELKSVDKDIVTRFVKDKIAKLPQGSWGTNDGRFWLNTVRNAFDIHD